MLKRIDYILETFRVGDVRGFFHDKGKIHTAETCQKNGDMV